MLKALAVAGVVGALSLVTVLPATADGVVDVAVDRGTGSGATVTVEVGHTSSSDHRSDGHQAHDRTGGGSTCTFAGEPIDCTSSAGVWSQERQCFVALVSPQPDTLSPIWGNHTDGAIWSCTPPGATFSAGTGAGFWFWAPAAGEPGAPNLVDPVTLAQSAIDRMSLAAPRIGMTPVLEEAPLLVGMDAWLWVDNDGPHAVGPITRSVSAGPTTVRATARVVATDWELGDGTTMRCPSAGTPWTPAAGVGPSPTCGHRYMTTSADQPAGVFQVSVSTRWRVDWSGGGQSGRITFALSGTRTIEVIELHVLQTG